MAIIDLDTPAEAPEAPVAEAAVAEQAAAPEATVNAGEAARKNVQLGNLDDYGTASGSIAFVGSLGDPSKPDKFDDKVYPTAVGYRFKALEDTMVPNFGLTPRARSVRMDHTAPENGDYNNPANWLKVKKGATFDLTLFETALLISQPQYAGRFNGGEHPVQAVYRFQATKNASQVATTNAAETPSVALRSYGEKAPSIKDLPWFEILTHTGETKENGQRVVHRQLIKGFEKFEPFTKIAQRSAGTSGTPEVNTTTIKNSQAFLQVLAARRG